MQLATADGTPGFDKQCLAFAVRLSKQACAIVNENEIAADVLPEAVLLRNNLRWKTDELKQQKSDAATSLLDVKQAVSQNLSTAAADPDQDVSAEETFRNFLQMRKRLNELQREWTDSNNSTIRQSEEVLRLQTLTESQSNLDLLMTRLARAIPAGMGRAQDNVGKAMTRLMAAVLGQKQPQDIASSCLM